MKYSIHTLGMKERRLLWFAGLENIENQITESDDNASEGNENESDSEKQRRLAELGSMVTNTMDTYADALDSFPDNLRSKFDDELYQYFEESIEGFDTNGAEGLSLEEYQKYKAHLKEKITQNMEQLASVLGATQERGEEREEEMENATGEAQEAERDLEQLESDITTFKQTTLSVLALDKEALQNTENPQLIQGQMKEYQDQFIALQEKQGDLMELSATLFQFRDKSAESLKLLDEGVDAAGAATYIAAGATIGTAIGGWAFGLGTVIGAVAGAVAYGVSKGVAAMAMSGEKEKQADAANAIIEEGKTQFASGSEQSAEAVEKFSVQGDVLNMAPEAFRNRAMRLGSEHTAEFQDQTQILQAKKDAKEAEKLRIQELRQEMEQKRQELLDRRDLIRNRSDEAKQNEEQMTLTGEEMRENVEKVDESISLIERRLEEKIADPKQRADLEKKLAKLKESKTRSSDGIAGIEEGTQQSREAGDEMESQLEETDASTLLIQDQDQMLLEASDMLTESIKQLDAQEVQLNIEQETFMASIEQEELRNIDAIDSTIADEVFGAELQNMTSLIQLDKQGNLLGELEPVTAPGFFSSLSDGFDGFANAAKWLFVDTISGSLDFVSEWLQEHTKNIPVLREITLVATNVLIGIPSGLIGGAGELLGGISTLIGHPVQAATGIGALIGLNSDIPAGTAWKELGKALMAYDEFAEGNVGKGVGKVALNVLLTVTGATAASAGAKAGAIAFRIARSAGAGVTRASLRAAATGTRIAATNFASGAIRAPGNIAHGVGKGLGAIVKSPVTIMRNMRMGKLAKLELSVAKYSDEAATLSQKGTALLKESKLPQELAHMSVDELATLARDGSRLAEMGIGNARSINAFLRYQTLTKQMARVSTSLRAAQQAQRTAELAEEMAAALPKIQSKIDELLVAAKKEKALAKASGDAERIKIAEANLEAAEVQNIRVNSVLDGKITLETYAEMRGIKSLTIREQQFLAQKILENSGKTIDDLIRMDDTVGVARSLSAESGAELGRASIESLSKTRGAETIVEGIQSGAINYKSLTQLDDTIRALPACPETTMLTELSDDLANMVRSEAITAEEAGIILRDSAEFLSDYKAAVSSGGFRGSSASSARELFDALRSNQRKLAHQTTVDRMYLTGSDHGVLHVIEGDMRMGTSMADDLIAQGRMTAQEKVIFRQSVIDHDMGYTINSLEQFGTSGRTLVNGKYEKLTGLGKGYYQMTKDHPLYSGILHESNKANYVRLLGEDGYRAMCVLDHSDPAGALSAMGALSKPRYDMVQWLITHADPMGVSADVKMMKLFQEPAMMEQMARAYELVPAFKAAKTLGTASPEYSAAMRSLATVRRNMKQMIRERYAGTADMDRFISSIDRFCDPRAPGFAATRDFGSHSLNFRGVAIEGEALVARFQVNNVFEALGRHFPAEEAAKIQTSAAIKALKDFGYKVNSPERLASRLGSLGDESVTVEQLITEGIVVKKAVAAGEWVTDTRFIFEGSRVAAQTADNLSLTTALTRQTALREALVALDTAPRTSAVYNKIIRNAAEQFDASYTLRGRPAPEVFREAERLATSGDYVKAQELIRELRNSGRGQFRSTPSAAPSAPRRAA